MFAKYSKSDRMLICDIMLGLGPTETTSSGEIVAFEGASPEVVSMEVPPIVPTAPRSPRPKPTPTREVPKPKKDKQKKLMPVRKSSRKHVATQA